jgi:hypothetical protein
MWHYYSIIIIIIIINPLSLQLMLEVLKEGNTLYKWGIGETANHMGYVKNAIVVIFQNFEPRFNMVNQLFSNFVQLRKCDKYRYFS